MAAVLTAIGTLIPLIVALIGTLRFPTLRRRVRDHSTLLKELPTDVGAPLKELLTAEVEQLVVRDQRRLDSRVRKILASANVGLITSAVSWVVGFILVSIGVATDAPITGPLGIAVIVAGSISVLSLVAAGVADRRARKLARLTTDRVTVSDLVRRWRTESGLDPDQPTAGTTGQS